MMRIEREKEDIKMSCEEGDHPPQDRDNRDPLSDCPIICLNEWLEGNEDIEIAKKATLSLEKYGILLIKDPRVEDKDSDDFINTMERYFERGEEMLKKDSRPGLSFQVGSTPPMTERPRTHCYFMKGLQPKDKPYTLCPPEADPKWRFFWRVGPRPKKTDFKELNAEPVVPEGFPEWENVMNNWGQKMLRAIEVVAEMTAVGLGLDKRAFRDRMEFGPHLLAPTGGDFSSVPAVGTVMAGFHYDLNFLTIHGKSRFPALSIWLRDGTKCPVSVPDGCLLVQAGKQMEILTGGKIKAGFHEVVVLPSTIEVVERRRREKKSLWRISSTVFGHIASDRLLENLLSDGSGSGSDTEGDGRSPVTAGEQVKRELRAIGLAV